jgi:hypothetical protein
MRDYLALQFKLVNRHLSDFGIQPALGYLLMAIIFSGFTAYLFYVSSFAAYVYALLALGFSSLLSEAGRTGFLKQHFSQRQFLIIRCVENITVVLPFIIGLLFYHEWLLALGLLFISAALSYTSIERNLNIVVPTPFYKYPFEFTTGFRKNYPVIFLAGFLMVMAVLYSNANLGLFAVALVLLVCLMFYMQSETVYLVWIHALSPTQFLLHKVSLALLYATLLCLPFAAVILIFFMGHAGYLALIYLLGMIYLATTVLGKYAFFPAPMNVPQGLLMAFSFWFPPMLLFLLPYFYKRSVRQLKPVLQ